MFARNCVAIVWKMCLIFEVTILETLEMYEFHLRPRESNSTVAVRLSVVVWPVHSTHRAAVLMPLAGPSPLPGSP